VGISAQPQSIDIKSGTTTTLAVTATGTTPKYQWYRGQSGDKTRPITGATNRTYTTPVITAPANYWVAVSNSCSTVNSRTATVMVSTTACTAPSITTQPASQTVTRGNTATLSVTAAGTGPFTYEWYRGGVGDTTWRLGTSQTFVTPQLLENSRFWVRVRNACGVTNSTVAYITVR
jgi:hypothetical protein